MIDIQKTLDILENSPSVKLLRIKNMEIIITFFVNTFPTQQGRVSYESIHTQLVAYLEDHSIENDEDSESTVFDTYEIKARKYIKYWADKGFLTDYQNENGDIFYELSSHSNKTINWLSNLKKEEYIGTESKFKNMALLI